MDVSAEHWLELSGLLDEALDLDADARASWLEREAQRRPELATMLRRLLAAHAVRETADLLAALPALNLLDPPAPGRLQSGESIGPYRLLRPLGYGGMAEVWLAERADGAFARRLALKLPLAPRWLGELGARFERERDILARLEHPNIARLYDAGVSADGLPYLAMEHVDGEPLVAWCDERRLDVAARLTLFAQVLEAVQYAHAHLVIHRDLKPSNILVTAQREVKLLDFGIAKLLEDDRTGETQLTQLGGRVLTPDYASPEQIKGEPLTIASDVYSLGVVLCELLSGRRPYRLKVRSVAQLEQAIVGAEPARPSADLDDAAASMRGTTRRRLAHALAGDLDTIVLKALAKAPAARYATVADLRDDLVRHRTGIAVHARPASWRYRAGKFVARNRLAVGAAGTVLAVLLAATAVSLRQAHEARAQAARAEAVKKFMLSFFESGDASYAGTNISVAELMRDARRRLDETPIGDDATRVELLLTIGSALASQGDAAPSEAAIAEAVRLADAHLGPRHPLTLEAHLSYGAALRLSQQNERALGHIRIAESGMEAVGDMAGLSAALRHHSLAVGDPALAVDLARRSVRVAEGQRVPPDLRITMKAHMNLANRLAANRTAAAEALDSARRSYELARELYGSRTTGLVVEAHVTYGTALVEAGRSREALTELQAALAEIATLGGTKEDWRALALRYLGRVEIATGDVRGALAHMREVVAIRTAIGEPPLFVAVARMNVGLALAAAHEPAQALAEWDEAARLVSHASGADHPSLRPMRAARAMALVRLGRLDEAEATLAALQGTAPAMDRDAAGWPAALGRLRLAQGRGAEAQQLLQQALDATPTPMRYERALLLADLGRALLAIGQAPAAAQALEQARAQLAGQQGRSSPDLADMAVDLARAQLAAGRPAEAKASADGAVRFWDGFDPRHHDAGLALLWQARAAAAAEQPGAASAALQRASEILGRSQLDADVALLAQTRQQLTGSLR